MWTGLSPNFFSFRMQVLCAQHRPSVKQQESSYIQYVRPTQKLTNDVLNKGIRLRFWVEPKKWKKIQVLVIMM